MGSKAADFLVLKVKLQSLFWERDFLFYAMHTCVQLAIFGQLHHARRMPCYLDIVLLVDNGHVSFEMDNIQNV